MSRSPSNLPLASAQSRSHHSPDAPLRYRSQLLPEPVLTSYEAGWKNLNLEYHCLPAGETPKLRFDHYLIAISLGESCQADLQIDGVNHGRSHRHIVRHGGTALVPANYENWGCWKQQNQGLTINLKMDFLTHHGAELLALDQVELLPQMMIYDPLILQMGLALKADLESQKPGGNLYAEAIASALAAHLLRNYATQAHRPTRYLGGLAPRHVQRVTDYINDRLHQELSLEELAALIPLSSYHFCRCFKQSTGLTPHQYVIRQRVERAKHLLRGGKREIRDVAIACEFTHQSHLHRHFKRLTGLTPKEFAKS